MTFYIVQDTEKPTGALWLVGEETAHPITEEEVKPIMEACKQWLESKEKS